MIQENEIRAQLQNYLSRHSSLDQFEDWFVQGSWNMHKDSSVDAQRLVGRIERLLGEYSSDHLNEDQLRERLQPLAYEFTVRFGTAAASASLRSDSTSVQYPRQFAGKLSAKAF